MQPHGTKAVQGVEADRLRKGGHRPHSNDTCTLASCHHGGAPEGLCPESPSEAAVRLSQMPSPQLGGE